MKKEQEKMTNQEKRFQLSNKDNCLVYEGNKYWWYTDYDICRDWWLKYGEMDNNRLFNFVNRVAAGFEMDEDEASVLLVFMLCCTLDDDYLNYYLKVVFLLLKLLKLKFPLLVNYQVLVAADVIAALKNHLPVVRNQKIGNIPTTNSTTLPKQSTKIFVNVRN